MPRFFIKCTYDGQPYNGWQSQPHSGTITVQETIEKRLSSLIQSPIALIGCGRTDTGVHALGYVAHFDAEIPFALDEFVKKLNKMLPVSISVDGLVEVVKGSHARFDPISRSYQYKLHIKKSPLLSHSCHYRYGDLDIEKLNQAAAILLEYNEFLPFCKANSDNKTFICILEKAEWTFDGNQYIFDITADRFLRGMIRLIVGMCINVSRDRLTLDEVKVAMNAQTRLREDWSVPACGLVLRDIVYPYPLWVK